MLHVVPVDQQPGTHPGRPFSVVSCEAAARWLAEVDVP